MENFNVKGFNAWLKTEMQKELNAVPSKIRERAKTDKLTFKIVLSSVCRKLCFNAKNLKVL